MKINSIIRSLIASALLLLFMLSITPKQYLHDLLADHQDSALNSARNGEAQLSVAGFSCDTHEQVAESPFTTHTVQLAVEPPVLFPTATTQHLISNLRLQACTAIDLRGPPATA